MLPNQIVWHLLSPQMTAYNNPQMSTRGSTKPTLLYIDHKESTTFRFASGDSFWRRAMDYEIICIECNNILQNFLQTCDVKFVERSNVFGRPRISTSPSKCNSFSCSQSFFPPKHYSTAINHSIMMIFNDNAHLNDSQLIRLNLLKQASIRSSYSTLHDIFPAPPNLITQPNNVMSMGI